MKAKALELRDVCTFIPALAVDMNPGAPYPDNGSGTEEWLDEQLKGHVARMYLLRRCGYACDGRPNIILTRLDGSGMASNDPYAWSGRGRTWPIAHDYIIKNWDALKDGDVIDVRFILGETSTPAVSERDDAATQP